MRFTKMHGIGNDYVYVNGFREKIEDPVSAARMVSDRHFGIGSDGLIIIQPSDRADCEMEMYNADGSRGKMCGNGIRCVGKYVYDNHIVDRDVITVDTLAGIRTLQLHVKDGLVDSVRVDMGAPILAPQQIPVDLHAAGAGLKTTRMEPFGEVLLNTDIALSDTLTMKGTCVSMGNPHCVVPVDDVASFDVEGIGKQFENHPIFPESVNTEFIHVEDRQNIRMRVWERGSGETWACGTGACATAAACILNGWTDPCVTIHLLGGDLRIEWDQDQNTIFMTGPAVRVFDGEIDL